MRYHFRKSGSRKRKARTKIFVGKKKTCFYYGDREYYRKEYLKSDHWKELRARKLMLNPKCERCGSDEHVEPHHLRYKNLYDVGVNDLTTLCRKCHNREHEDVEMTEYQYRNLCEEEKILIERSRT